MEVSTPNTASAHLTVNASSPVLLPLLNSVRNPSFVINGSDCLTPIDPIRPVRPSHSGLILLRLVGLSNDLRIRIYNRLPNTVMAGTRRARRVGRRSAAVPVSTHTSFSVEIHDGQFICTFLPCFLITPPIYQCLSGLV